MIESTQNFDISPYTYSNILKKLVMLVVKAAFFGNKNHEMFIYLFIFNKKKKNRIIYSEINISTLQLNHVS